MELMHPLVLIIGIPVLLLLCILLHVIPALRKRIYKGGLRTGASSIVKSLPVYKIIVVRKIILTIFNELFMVMAIIAALVLIARPYKIQTIKTGVQKRDIFLCLDVSYSMYDLNYALADYLEQVVMELKGDRFGITMFNSSSLVYVPLTDDYDYVVMRMEELKEYFSLQKDYWTRYVDHGYYKTDLIAEEWDQYSELQNKLSYFEAGTLVDLETKGSSLVGEGLASALYSFPSIGDSKRTRVIILVTDNEKTTTKPQFPEVKEAFELCKRNDVKVFAVYPCRENFYSEYTDKEYKEWSDELKWLTEYTGGEFYIEDKEKNSVPDIVEKIREHEAMTVDDIVMKRKTDLPVPGIIVLLIGLTGSIICTSFLKGK